MTSVSAATTLEKGRMYKQLMSPFLLSAVPANAPIKIDKNASASQNVSGFCCLESVISNFTGSDKTRSRATISTMPGQKTWFP